MEEHDTDRPETPKTHQFIANFKRDEVDYRLGYGPYTIKNT